MRENQSWRVHGMSSERWVNGVQSLRLLIHSSSYSSLKMDRRRNVGGFRSGTKVNKDPIVWVGLAVFCHKRVTTSDMGTVFSYENMQIRTHWIRPAVDGLLTSSQIPVGWVDVEILRWRYVVEQETFGIAVQTTLLVVGTQEPFTSPSTGVEVYKW